MDKVSVFETVNGLEVIIWKLNENSYDVSVVEVGSIDEPLTLLYGVSLDKANDCAKTFLRFILKTINIKCLLISTERSSLD